MSLQKLREMSERPAAKLLMGVLVVSFVGWGAASWLFDGGVPAQDTSLIKIGRADITLADYQQERGRFVAQLGRAMQQELLVDKVQANEFGRQVLLNMAGRTMMEQQAEALGLAVSPAAVANVIKQSPEFWENGEFSTGKFDAVLDMNGLTEQYYTETLRRQLLREMLLDATTNILPAPDFAVSANLKARYKRRKIEYQTITFSDFKIAGNPTDEDLKLTAAKNPKMVPEYRTISYILVPTNFTNPAGYEKGLEKIKSVEDMLIAGDAMRDAAKKMRADYRELPPMTIQRKTATGESKDIALTDKVMSELFQLEQGGESEITEAKHGFVIFRVEKIAPAHAVPLDERKAELTALWKQSEQEKQAYKKGNELLLETDKKLSQTANIGRADGAPLEILSMVYQLPVNKRALVAGQGAFYVVNVVSDEGVRPEDLQKKNEVAKEMAAEIRQQILDDYSRYLSRKYDLKLNEKLLLRTVE